MHNQYPYDLQPLNPGNLDEGLFPQGIVQKEQDKFLKAIKSEFPDKFCPSCGSPMWPINSGQYQCQNCKYVE